MLNKNDPLIGAVQEVMKRNQIEREATRLVNEAFGIEDRKALPHEYQAEWDAAYHQVLAEAVDPSKYSEKQKRFAATAGDKRVIDGPDLDHVRKHGGKHIEERKLNPYAVGMAAVKKSMDESAGAPGGMVDYMQKKAKREAAQKASQNKGSDPTNRSGGMRAGAVAPRGSDPTNTDSGQRAGAAQPKPPKPKLKPVAAAPKASAPKAAAPKAAAPKVAAQPKKKLTFFQKSELARSRKNDTMDQTRNLERRYGVRAPMKKAKRSVFGEQIRDIVAQRIDEIYVNPNADTPAGRAYKQTLQKKGAGAPLQAGQKWNAPNRSMGSDPTNTAKGTRVAAGPKAPAVSPALDPTRNAALDQPATKSPMAAALNRQDLAKSVQAGRVGDPGKQNFIQNARAQKEREKAAGGDGTKYLPVPPNVQRAIKDNQPKPGRPQTLSPGANPPAVSKNMGGGGGDYRKAQASSIKVSDTEVMNDPKFKKGLSSVGGTQAAKKIQTGERVAGLGRFNKGDTIMSRVRTDIAARKNVGRES